MGKIYKSITGSEAKVLLSERSKDGNFVILDIRTAPEFMSGAVPGAVNMDYYDPDFFGKMKGLDKQKSYLIYCRSGSRSKGALEIMEELDFQEVYELDRGINSL